MWKEDGDEEEGNKDSAYEQISVQRVSAQIQLGCLRTSMLCVFATLTRQAAFTLHSAFCWQIFSTELSAFSRRESVTGTVEIDGYRYCTSPKVYLP